MSDYFLADDLSGALDAAAAFHAHGRRVTIGLSSDVWPTAEPGALVGLTTETRNASPETAASIVTHAIEAARRRGARLVYKKIDSTMRGPVGAELEALVRAMPDTRVLFTPANPRVGRTVREGRLYVHGVPVSETEFARDPANPVRESVLQAALGIAARRRIQIVDATSESDLDAAVERMVTEGGPWVAVGSGALARPVAARMEPAPNAARPQALEVPSSRLLFVGGSAHPANREQATILAREQRITVHDVSIDAPSAAAVAAGASLRRSGAAALLIQEARTTRDIALRAIVAAALQVIEAAEVRRVFVTGGETAFALCRGLEIEQLDFAAEIEPGLSVSRAHSRQGPMLLAVKPGGFGDAQTWVRGWAALRSG